MPCDDTDKGQWVAETASRPLIENRRPASQQGRLPQSRQSPYDCWSWAAHPADSFDQVGGTLAHHAAEGDHVSALILSGGVRSHDWQLVDYHLKSDDGFDVEKETTEATTPKEDEVRRACGCWASMT